MAARILLALLAGVLLTFGFAPFHIWPLVPAGIILWLSLLAHKTPTGKQAFVLGWVFGLGWFGAGISWVHVSIEQFGGLPLIGSLGLMLLLCAYLALFPGLFAWLLTRFFPVKLWPLAAPALWFVIEWLRSWLLTGFPWLSVGYSQLGSPLAGWFPLIGESGVSALLILLCTCLVLAISNKQWLRPILVSAVLLVSGLVLNKVPWSQLTGETVSIALVQGNIKQALRWVPEQDTPTMQKYLQLSAPLWAKHQIVIWPEAAIPKLEPVALDYLQQVDALAADNGSALVTGIVNYRFDTRQAFNSIIALGNKRPGDNHGHYQYLHSNRFSKHHLLPIGEFIPMEDWLRGLAPIFDLPMSSFTRGTYQQSNILVNGHDLAPALCFEIAFPRQVGANLYPDTDFILTLSNDAWFGDSHGPAQHLQIAQARAKEFGMPVLRATNNGITAIVNHQGKIIAQAPQFADAVLSHQVAKAEGKTPYRKWRDKPMWVLVLASLGIACWLLRKRV